MKDVEFGSTAISLQSKENGGNKWMKEKFAKRLKKAHRTNKSNTLKNERDPSQLNKMFV
jgi:hypothetical protein